VKNTLTLGSSLTDFSTAKSPNDSESRNPSNKQGAFQNETKFQEPACVPKDAALNFGNEMKKSPLASILTLLIVLCSPLRAGEEIIYLHWFSPTSGQAIQWEDQPKVKDPTPPAKIITLRVHIGRDFKASLPRHGYDSPVGHISGKVSKVGEAMTVTLKGSYASNSFAFSGNVELEKVFEPQVNGFSGVIYTILCVLSEHKEIEPFLKAQAEADAERLRLATERSKRYRDEERKKAAAEQAAPSNSDEPAK
jgi:hypothetical protein